MNPRHLACLHCSSSRIAGVSQNHRSTLESSSTFRRLQPEADFLTFPERREHPIRLRTRFPMDGYHGHAGELHHFAGISTAR